ncbi:hypothetical protein GDO78_018879 [Eleutherodactylus coqui]|uniref:Uncharacterized protein n=1 Tax=Eleutherodactylus coqui TaxID=57060 RepID=A0A8J6ECJ8_ELECQ|nr:hypothetical protein GDO78_018879 [Eleutherodactylus coqui]
MDGELWLHYTRIFLREVFLAMKWMAVEPPSVSVWMRLVDAVIPYKKVIHQHRGCLNKYGNFGLTLSKHNRLMN